MYFGDVEFDHEVVKQETRYVRLVNGVAKDSNTNLTISDGGPNSNRHQYRVGMEALH